MKYAASPKPVLGPCACQDCGEPVFWARRLTTVDTVSVGSLRWRDWAGHIHRCPGKPVTRRVNGPRRASRPKSQIRHETIHHARTWDNESVGISDASPDIMCDALLVADTSREGVPRLEVSAPMTTDVR